MTAHVVAPASRNRLQLVLIFLIPFAGLGMAAWMYFSGQLVPDGRNEQGYLLWPPKALVDFQWQGANGKVLTAKQLDGKVGVGDCGQPIL